MRAWGQTSPLYARNLADKTTLRCLLGFRLGLIEGFPIGFIRRGWRSGGIGAGKRPNQPAPYRSLTPARELFAPPRFCDGEGLMELDRHVDGTGLQGFPQMG